ncbi:semaphorin-7A isoform X2 [Thalassophryne amazonica]|uniref:semaphorin-7A isoform X2 n=1 Tax=Thalassophryne amazonica TaxID=390379 RepID=UPI001470CDE7|nr:semaphorin-7A isoform X2 [Thalassophryne amazonica]
MSSADRKMSLLSLLFVFRFIPVTETNTAQVPRMILTNTGMSVNRLWKDGVDKPARILLGQQPDSVTVVGQRHLESFNFQNPQKPPMQWTVLWDKCLNSSVTPDCDYDITVFHLREEENRVFVCGTNSRETLCCNMVTSAESLVCAPTDDLRSIETSIKNRVLKEGELSLLVESPGAPHLYITHSGTDSSDGIHKIGKDKVGPSYHTKEQHYVGLMLSRRPENNQQDRIYAFYNEKNRDPSMDASMWLPFVTQVCMADKGGRKNNLQFKWTSQMSARLYCGDRTSRQHYSELVGMATVPAEQWQDTKVYGLFRNQWGFSAACVYTIRDIHDIFMKSPLKSSGNPKQRSRLCVADSTMLSAQTLKEIEETSEVEDWVQPLNASGPLLFSHHHYKHIAVDTFQDERNNRHTVLFLSLQNGAVHKVMENHEGFIIAEYQPFHHRAHILSMTLQPSTRRLYVSSRHEVVQLDVANCVQYGDSCEECVLARDPYCGWNGTQCVPHGRLQDVNQGNHMICKSSLQGKGISVTVMDIPPQSMCMLRCPVSSHHAEYTWQHHEWSTGCSWKEQDCLLLIDNMGTKEAGNYTCVFEEKGFSKTLRLYQLRVKSRAAEQTPKPLVWICLIWTVLKNLCS